MRGAFSAVVQMLRERGFVSMFVRLHPILELPDGALTGLGTSISPSLEDVPSSVELRWRPGEHQAAFT
jgi:hypothetical protein